MIHEFQLLGLEASLMDNISVIENIINKYGVLKSGKDAENDDNLISNYLFYCLTKGHRSLRAAHFLAEQGFFEDIFILLRSAYEAYLHMSFIKKNPTQIHRFTTIKMGIQSGEFEHPKNKKTGQDIKHKIIDPLTKKEFIIDLTLSKISKHTLYEIDGKIHEGLYSYLSQFSHVNITAMGHYVSFNSKKFIIESEYENKIFQTVILSLFVSWLLLDVVSSFSDISKKDYKTINKQIKLSGLLVNNYVQTFEPTDDMMTNLIENILLRLNEVLNLTNHRSE